MNEKKQIKPAKACYDHIGGKLGTLILDMCLQKGWLQRVSPTEKRYFITELGMVEFAQLGLDLSQIKSEEL